MKFKMVNINVYSFSDKSWGVSLFIGRLQVYIFYWLSNHSGDPIGISPHICVHNACNNYITFYGILYTHKSCTHPKQQINIIPNSSSAWEWSPHLPPTSQGGPYSHEAEPLSGFTPHRNSWFHSQKIGEVRILVFPYPLWELFRTDASVTVCKALVESSWGCGNTAKRLGIH
jgi:hypothetical protein